jgi:molecular chaperone HtpG
MTTQTFEFQTEVSRLLHIVTHALYSDKDIFLRELVSNASDASDKMKYLALSNPAYSDEKQEYKVVIKADEAAGTLTISDYGIGMDEEDLKNHLGTIAKSGTAAFLKQLEDSKNPKDIQLIGQFGVGFYSAFMISDFVTVVSKKAGSEKAYTWNSEGSGSYTLSEASREGRGTDVILKLKEEDKNYLQKEKLSEIIRKYSDHIAIPIVFKEENSEDQLNKASALWTRSKSEISEQDYKEFYHHTSHAFDDPWQTIHYKAEGAIDYKALLFIPTLRPYDLFHPERKNNLKLFVKKVFITESCEGLLPSYLRFVTGVVDSEDLPLNISRETLQVNPYIAKIKTGLTKKIFDELLQKSKENPEDYNSFFEKFGPVLKEGLYEDASSKETLLKLCRFSSSENDQLISLEDYVANLKEGQEAIYYCTGDSLEAIRQSPHLEGFKMRSINVLFLTDPIDDFWLNNVEDYQGKPLKSITRASTDFAQAEIKTEENTKSEEKLKPFLAMMKLALQEVVKDVRLSNRLQESPVCLVADDADLDIRLERLLRQHGQKTEKAKRILELNEKHPLIHKMSEDLISKDKNYVNHMAHVLYEQGRILEGETVSNPKAFCNHLNELLKAV